MRSNASASSEASTSDRHSLLDWVTELAEVRSFGVLRQPTRMTAIVGTGVHSETPTFLTNIHKIDNEKDARADIARLNGVPKLFDQLIVNLKAREEHGVIPPKFVFPLVLEACANVTKGQPFEDSGIRPPSVPRSCPDQRGRSARCPGGTCGHVG